MNGCWWVAYSFIRSRRFFLLLEYAAEWRSLFWCSPVINKGGLMWRQR
jgi:hypothetical protein